MPDNIISALKKGCPVKGLTNIIPWGTAVDQVSSFGSPFAKTWKRWGETSIGLKEITFTSLQWRPVDIQGLPSIQSASIEFRQPAILHSPDAQLFNSIVYYFENAETMENELLKNFGAPDIQQVVLLERGGDEYDEKIWRPIPDFGVSIVFHPASALRIHIES
jgi:hypothetical protein